MNTYSIEFYAKCPSNGVRIKYALTIQTTHLIMVEDIVEFIEDNTAKPVYQEALAEAIASMFPGVHTMRAHHHGVDIETVRGRHLEAA